MPGNDKPKPWRSLRFQILLITFLSWLIPTVVLSHFILNLLPRLRNQASASLSSEAENAFEDVSGHLDRLLVLGRDATYDGELASAWERRQEGFLGEAEYVRLCRSYLERKYGREELCSFGAFLDPSLPDRYLSTRADSAQARAFREGLLPRMDEIASSLDTRCLFLVSGDSVFLVRNLMDTRMNPFGVLVLGLPRETLFRPAAAVAGNWQGESLLLLNEDFPEEDGYAALPDGLSDPGGNLLLFLRRRVSRDWSLSWALRVPRSLLWGDADRFLRLLLALYLVLIGFSLLIGWFARRRLTRPIRLLAEASRRVEDGEFGVTVPMQGQDELGALGRAFSSMSLRLKELIDRTYKEEIALRDARIQALQSRINPHFINNALEDINWQARIDGSQEVSRMVSALSVLLNAAMASRDRRVVPLREELRVADAYITFIRERFGDSLVLTRSVAEEVLSDRLPLLTIQPVLENAVEHGIAPAAGGAIDLNCRREDNCLVVSIRNSGRPMDDRDRERIRAALSGESSGKHVGLGNIAGRLRLIYHGEADISCVSDPEGRTLVILRVPQNLPEEPDPEAPGEKELSR